MSSDFDTEPLTCKFQHQLSSSQPQSEFGVEMYCMYSWSHKQDSLALSGLKTRHSALFSFSSLCGNDGCVPYRRLCTMAQVPLNLRKFLPEANIARNSNLGLSWSLTVGSNNSQCNNGNYLILSSRLRSSSDTVWGAHSVFLRLIKLPEKHTASNQATTIGSVRCFKPQVVTMHRGTALFSSTVSMWLINALTFCFHVFKFSLGLMTLQWSQAAASSDLSWLWVISTLAKWEFFLLIYPFLLSFNGKYTVSHQWKMRVKPLTQQKYSQMCFGL